MAGFADATGLMAFWSDIDDDYVLRYQEWHNCEHVPERVAIPGFLRGRRYRDGSGAAHFLMMYETAATSVLSSDAYLAALNAPTDWTREALTHFRNPVRNIYSLLAGAGAPGAFCAPWLTALRFNAPDVEAAQGWVAAIASADGIDRAQLWAVDEAVSGIQTSERKIYGGGPGEQQYLLLIEATCPGATTETALQAADRATPGMTSRTDVIPGQYWLEIFHEAPEN